MKVSVGNDPQNTENIWVTTENIFKLNKSNYYFVPIGTYFIEVTLDLDNISD